MTAYHQVGVHIVVVKGYTIPVVIFPHEHDCWHWIDSNDLPRNNYNVLFWPFGSGAGSYTACKPPRK